MISVVICSINTMKFAAVSESYRKALGEEPHEIVRISDAKSLAEGYNRGLRKTTGEIVVFSHDDVEILTADFRERLLQHLATFDVVGVAGTDRLINGGWAAAGPPHLFGQVMNGQPKVKGGRLLIFGTPRRVVGGMQALDGMFLAFRRPVIEAIGWDEKTFDGWHGYDIDCTFRAHLAGYRLAVANDILLMHHSVGNYSAEWLKYVGRVVEKHREKLAAGSSPRYQICQVDVATKEAALALMPGYWED